MKNYKESVLMERRSIRNYDQHYIIPKEDLEKLFELTLRAPSSKNLQHWKFVVIQGDEVQEKLFHIANNQQMVRDASAVIAVLGDLEAYRNGEIILEQQVKSGKIDEDGKDSRMERIMNTYESRGLMYPREAAYLNGGLAAMQLMIAATTLGYGTCPIGGFDKQKFVEAFTISNRYIPLMLVPIGKPLSVGNETIRLSQNELVEYIIDN